LTFLTVYNNGRISEEDLRRAYSTFLRIHPVNLGDHSDKSFEGVRKLAVKSLLNRNQIAENKFEYVLFNPSIADFVLSSYSGEDELISNILISLESEVSIRYLQTLTIYGKISKNSLSFIQEKLFENFFDEKIRVENWDFLILLSYLDFFNVRLNKRIEKFIEFLLSAEYARGNNLSELLAILTDFDPPVDFKNFDFLHNFIDEITDPDTLKELLNFIDRFNIEDEYILSQTGKQIESYLRDMVDNNYLDIDYGQHIRYSYYPDGYPDNDFDIEGIESDVYKNLDSFLDGFNESVLGLMEINKSDIVSGLDLENMAIRYLEGQGSDDDDRGGSGYNYRSSSQDDIDAIFER